jgi:glutamate-1-semialdehyde 2,1-aminomutase
MESLHSAIDDARSRYVSANPLSQTADEKAAQYLPGGNTRTVLHYEPFPLTMVAGDGAELTDLDGHQYVDFVGEYSAALFGHSNETIKRYTTPSIMASRWAPRLKTKESWLACYASASLPLSKCDSATRAPRQISWR